jgi:XRE family transcriptional regulator, aerobic/anaerobic benzoate catabolism transcriptional regulator
MHAISRWQALNCISNYLPPAAMPESSSAAKDPFLIVLGERVRLMRSRRGVTRKVLAREAEISERHLANLETGTGNASVLLLRQLAQALNCSMAELVGQDGAASPELILIRQLLRGRDEATLQRARLALADLLGAGQPDPSRTGRIALIGLRGAGKSSLGRMLADDLGIPFVELNRVVEQIVGCGVHEIHSLYGSAAYRRYEQRALEETVAACPKAVIATAGGLVSEAPTYDLLLSRCYTVWLRATPEEHMDRVVAQGDMRPMAGNAEAMDDLKRILAGREAFYAKADLTFDTGGRTLADAFIALRAAVIQRLPQEFNS